MATVLNHASAPPQRPGPYKVDISRGSRIGRVSSEWFSRPDDERYLSLRELHAATLARSRRATTRTVETREVRVEASRDNAERLALIVPGRDEPIAPTHWSFGQLCSLVGAPSGYLRELPAPLAGINLQHGLLNHRAELMKTLETEDGRTELRAVTGPDYGRIWDHELVAAVMKIAGNGTGDTRWKVPGLLDWSTMMHNPHVEITKDTTTLYASDRDVFLFLVDDAHPIEAGRLPNGDPDLFFRGFYTYVAGGGCVVRDLFEEDRGGWLQDAALLDRLVLEKLGAEADRIRTEGWKWVEAAIDLSYGYHFGLRPIEATHTPPTEADLAEVAKLQADAEALEAEWSGADEIPDEVDARVNALDERIAELAGGSWDYDPAEMAMAGVFVTIGRNGDLSVDPGWVRVEDEPVVESEPHGEGEGEQRGDGVDGDNRQPGLVPESGGDEVQTEEEDEGLKPLPDRLISELTAERTLALQDAIAGNPQVAFAAVLHNFVLACLYYGHAESCLTVNLSKVGFGFQPSGMKDSPAAVAIEARHAMWKERLPQSDRDLWDGLQLLDGNERAELFAHCAAYSVNALYEVAPKYDNGRISAHAVERRLAHSHVLARAVGLDMVASGWKPTADNFFGKVTKARIIDAVTEGKGGETAALIDHLKKPDMAREAERLMDGAGWLPEPLRTPELPAQSELLDAPVTVELPAFLAEPDASGDEEPMTIAAE